MWVPIHRTIDQQPSESPWISVTVVIMDQQRRILHFSSFTEVGKLSPPIGDNCNLLARLLSSDGPEPRAVPIFRLRPRWSPPIPCSSHNAHHPLQLPGFTWGGGTSNTSTPLFVWTPKKHPPFARGRLFAHSLRPPLQPASPGWEWRSTVGCRT